MKHMELLQKAQLEPGAFVKTAITNTHKYVKQLLLMVRNEAKESICIYYSSTVNLMLYHAGQI